ncbi:MAG TPA: hypothetical protein PK614_05015, partial [Nitrospira sp.]|nr:hypothetical protein [Nitrospira sp.]
MAAEKQNQAISIEPASSAHRLILMLVAQRVAAPRTYFEHIGRLWGKQKRKASRHFFGEFLNFGFRLAQFIFGQL